MTTRLRNDKGSALLITLLIMLMLTLIFVAAVTTSVTDIDIAKNQKERTAAFYVAEAGLEMALGVLRANSSLLSNDSLESLVNAASALGNSSFNVDIVDSMSYKMITSQGFSRDGEVIVQVMAQRQGNPHCIWDNIIFAGAGQAGKLIAGNVSIHGSVHLLGDGLGSGDVALDIGGGAAIYNNYSGINATLSSRLPDLDTTSFNGEVVRTLTSELRVKHGRVDISGASSAGFSDSPGGSPPIKETLDGCYVSDGYGGNKGTSSVYSDNGTGEGYDLGDALGFPDLTESYLDTSTGITYPSYMNYLQSNALVISGDLTLKPGQSLSSMSNGFGSISMDGSGNMQISGIVYVTGDITIDAGSGGMKHTPVTYDGTGTLVSGQDINISTHVISDGTFPTDDVLGFIAADDLGIGTGSGDSHLNVMGAFFAQDQLSNAKQNQLAGAMVSNYFDIKNVPDLFHVPSIVSNLPPGMPGGGTVETSTFRIVSGTWHEL